MNVAAVRKMTGAQMRRIIAERELEVANTQTCVTRCAKCPRWYFRGTVADGKRAFALHLESKGHNRINQKRGPQAKTRDRHAGFSWA